MLATDSKDYAEAETWFRRSIELKADFRSALFNLALLLNNDLKRPFDAVPYLTQLLKVSWSRISQASCFFRFSEGVN